jgi:hypothetical protein
MTDPDRADPIGDLSEFERAAPAKSKPPAAAVRQVSEANGFTANRAPPPVAPPQRRHRTGRNVQLNIKASRETIDAFIALSDAEGWVLGETLDHLLQHWKASK